jgi:DNA-binding LacI/PurR family transcriptional regulator
MLQLAQLRRPPTAVFARNDFTAIGAMHAARTLGLSIPEDLAIAGFDNIPLAAFTAPPLTTVEQPIARQGIEAARFLLERIRGEVRSSRSSIMECRLIVRQSTDPEAGVVK